MHKFGLHVSPVSSKDYLLSSFIYDEVLPHKFDLTPQMTPVGNQGSEGSCVGFATALGVKEYQEQKERKKFISLSPRFIYEEAKKISGHTEGTTLKAAMQVIQKLGVCEEGLWPYIADSPGVPFPGAYKDALQYCIKTYARVTTLIDLKRAIISKIVGATLIGITVYKGMLEEGARVTGIVPDPSCWDRAKPLGGHALTACGYNDQSPYFRNDGHVKVKNSWDAKYGDKGYNYLSYKYINAHMVDAYSCIDIVEPLDNVIKLADLPRKMRKAWVA